MKRALLGAAIAALCLVAACDEPHPAAATNRVEPKATPCKVGEPACQYDDGELK